MDKLSYLSNADTAYIDMLYQMYLNDPESVDFGWKKFFEGFDFGVNSGQGSDATSHSAPEHVLKEINVLNEISKGNVNAVKDWLTNNVFKYASMLDPNEWIIKVTGEKLNTKYYIDYLNKKFRDLYNL